jgi:hypothetical protein
VNVPKSPILLYVDGQHPIFTNKYQYFDPVILWQTGSIILVMKIIIITSFKMQLINKDRLNLIKKELESIKKENPVFKSQLIQIESLDISKNYEETKKAFDRVCIIYFHLNFFIFNRCIYLADRKCRTS